MAITLAHPAAIIPLKRLAAKGYLSFSALVVGSMIPDIGYLAPYRETVTFTHTIWGALGVGIPIGLITLWIFHNILKRPLLSLLPTSYQKQFIKSPPFDLWPLSKLTIIIISIAIGVLTHIFWDGFTHGRGWAVVSTPFLTQHLFQFFDLKVRTYYLVKHGSSTLGLTIVLYGLLQHFQTVSGWRLDLGISLKTIIFLTILGIGTVVGLTSYIIGYAQTKNIVGGSIMFIFLCLIVTSLIRWVYIKQVQLD
ncbi:MAG: DUF4184 family protein [Chloroflexota bacterium]